ncbi:MAG: nucleotidyltransferase family protein, partial [Oscillospiraceae bacterium]
MMPAVLRRLTPQQLSRTPDISEGLENRIYAAIRQATTMEEVYSFAKSKRYTAARIRRVIMSACLGVDGALGTMPAPYRGVLVFNTGGREILARMRETARLPVSDSPAYLKRLGEACAVCVDAEATATDLYMLGLPHIRPCGYDFTANGIRPEK